MATSRIGQIGITFLMVFLSSCNVQPDSTSLSEQPMGINCQGVFFTHDAQGNLQKWNQYFLNGQCLTDSLPLSHWETTSEAWQINNVQCTPQPQFKSRTLISANNYYQYADGKVYLDLDSSTGIFRRLTFAEDRRGASVYSRLQGCFYQRPSNVYGDQILLDTDIRKTASSQAFDPLEIFTYTSASSDFLEMVRFDDVADWDYRFCPAESTPWGYCDALRNGDDLYFPALTDAQKDALTTEAKLIRQMYNYTSISISTFESLWQNPGQTVTEASREDYAYIVQALPDTPPNIWSSWRDYVIGNCSTPPGM